MSIEHAHLVSAVSGDELMICPRRRAKGQLSESSRPKRGVIQIQHTVYPSANKDEVTRLSSSASSDCTTQAHEDRGIGYDDGPMRVDSPPRLKRAQVPYRDMYSLRWTFVSLARASGEAAFNVSRVIGHARSTIVDTIYAHTVDSALAGVSDRVGLTGSTPPAAPDPPTAPGQPPKLRVIEGGRRPEETDQRDIRRTIDDARARSPRERTSD
jgi:hypothetical protein